MFRDSRRDARAHDGQLQEPALVPSLGHAASGCAADEVGEPHELATALAPSLAQNLAQNLA